MALPLTMSSVAPSRAMVIHTAMAERCIGTDTSRTAAPAFSSRWAASRTASSTAASDRPSQAKPSASTPTRRPDRSPSRPSEYRSVGTTAGWRGSSASAPASTSR